MSRFGAEKYAKDWAYLFCNFHRRGLRIVKLFRISRDPLYL
jgi:hypothetical protein